MLPLDVYSLVSVLPRLPLVIESLATYGKGFTPRFWSVPLEKLQTSSFFVLSDDTIFVGTKEGHLLMYKIELRGTFNKGLLLFRASFTVSR